MKKTLIIIIGVVILAAGGYFAYAALKKDDKKQTPTVDNTSQNEQMSQGQPPMTAEPPLTFTFEQPKKSAHYTSNTPEHGTVLDTAPAEVSITFNFDLSPKSTISVTKDGQEVSTGAAMVSADKLVLTKALASNPGKGLYTVHYNACWPDESCHDGHFQFGVK